ncbi:hypothetical protein F5X99DRAFT_176979 [Biscogniauxia marginata]|nr:hypothetical protein F5X99DRAFT_176979 [Biscogniauxia marginata]
MTLHLAQILGGAGHVLVHYLFTSMYECLKPRGSSCYEKDAAEFATCVRVYAVARDYELPDLEGLARGEIEKLGNPLQVMEILDVLKHALPNLSVDDMWLRNYLKSLVRPFIDNPPASLGSLALHMTHARPKDNTQESIVLNQPSILYNEKIDIPLTIGAKGHIDVHGPFMGIVERFQHICPKERYANFSPEELQWKHELYSKMTGFEV